MISENAKIRWQKDFEHGVSLSFAPKSVQSDKELVMYAVKINGMNLQFASDEFKNDIEIVGAAIRQKY